MSPVLLSAILLANVLNGFSAENSKMLKVYSKDEDGVTHMFVENLEESPVTATFEMHLENMKGSAEFPYTTAVPAKKTVEVFTLSPVQARLPWRYNYTHFSMMGTPAAIHDESFAYRLPYAPGTSHRVSQGFHGSFSHTGPDEFAIDWKMPEGTEVHAARGGTVVKSKDDSNEGGADLSFKEKANCVFILHDDGTIGMYAHLKQGGNVVKPGDRVQNGDFLGLSGNTGFSSGAHLHFAVFKTKNGKERVSLPMKFLTANEGLCSLTMNHSYEAMPLHAKPTPLVIATASH